MWVQDRSLMGDVSGKNEFQVSISLDIAEKKISGERGTRCFFGCLHEKWYVLLMQRDETETEGWRWRMWLQGGWMDGGRGEERDARERGELRRRVQEEQMKELEREEKWPAAESGPDDSEDEDWVV